MCACACARACACACACVNEQHLQEGRKAQQYLDHCWKQMDNVSEEGGMERNNEVFNVKILFSRNSVSCYLKCIFQMKLIIIMSA